MATGLGPQVFHDKGQERCWYSEHLGQGANTLHNPLYLCTLLSAVLFLPFEHPK